MSESPSDTAPNLRRLTEQLDRVKQKADQAAAEKKICTMTALEARALAEALEELIEEIEKARKHVFPAATDSALERWRESEWLPMFEVAAMRNARELGREIAVLWQPTLDVFNVFDPKHMGLAAGLGWMQVAIAYADGSLVRAPRILVDVERPDAFRVPVGGSN